MGSNQQIKGKRDSCYKILISRLCKPVQQGKEIQKGTQHQTLMIQLNKQSVAKEQPFLALFHQLKQSLEKTKGFWWLSLNNPRRINESFVLELQRYSPELQNPCFMLYVICSMYLSVADCFSWKQRIVQKLLLSLLKALFWLFIWCR